jgi:hypothetical protein
MMLLLIQDKLNAKGHIFLMMLLILLLIKGEPNGKGPIFS